VGRDACADSTHVAVESASGDSHVGRQPEACGPFGRQLADGFVGRLGLIEQTGAEARKQRVECREELLRGESSPLLVPHGLVPACAAAADNVGRRGDARKQRGQPLAVLDDRICGLAYLLVLAQHMQRLGPIPLRRVDAALVGRIVGIPLVAQFVYLGGLLNGRMVFPQHEHGVGVLGELRQHGQRRARTVCEYGRAARGVEGYAYDLFGRAGGALRQGILDGSLQNVDIVLRMLAVAVGGRIAILALAPARIVFDRGGYGLARLGVYDYGAGRVAAVIQTYFILIEVFGWFDY